MTDPRATDAAARIHERAPDLADEPIERLVRDYLDAAEPHDLATLTADDVAGAVIAILRLGRDRPGGGRVVAVANPSAARDGWDSPHTVGRRRHRRRPVPRRQRQRGARAARLRPPPAAPPAARAPRRRHDVAPAPRDRPRDRSGGAGAPSTSRCARWSTTCSRRSTTGTRCATAWPSSPVRCEEHAAAPRRSRRRGGGGDVPGLAGRRPLHVRRRGGGGRRRRRRARLRARGGASARAVPRARTRRPHRRLAARRSPSRCNTPPSTATVPLDAVDIRRFGPDGTAVGETRLLGLYTENVYSQSAEAIPLLRRKVAQVMARSGLRPSSHDGRALAHVLETYPRDELFRLDARRAGRARAGHRRHGAAPARAALRQPRPERLLRVVPRVPAARPVHDDRPHRRWSTRCDARSTGATSTSPCC